MAKKVSAFRQYLNSSRTLHYSLILTLPVLAIYEFGNLILFRDSFFELRNSGEILLRSFFDTIHLTNPYLISAILVGAFIVVMVRGYRIEKRPGIHANYYIYMLLESIFWGALLFTSMQLFTRLPLQILRLEDKLANMNLALGAGIFEELIFRLVLIGALMVILEQGLNIVGKWSVVIAIILAAIVFAGFHLFMESYQFPIFAQRILGGILLGTLYYFRGYGISVYTHIIYNFLILADSW